ncbi:hypothetical protein N0B31_09855 [Salinirubellus salinus]|uniref:DUF8173 domain-containing protein n=1 Tax=Salinirubellus salinus TaxID=1364945 RepID=A0A9E7R679_9EURY|nr:hypothetical protein [Salinirubellus salinus]UWM56579.1 hypothetical protein N0B31_09855 [Salinirubellus salinus]
MTDDPTPTESDRPPEVTTHRGAAGQPPRDAGRACDATSSDRRPRRVAARSRPTGRRLLVVAVVAVVVLAGGVGVVDAVTASDSTTVPSAGEAWGGAPTDPMLRGPGDGTVLQVSEFVLRASLLGDAVLRAGFFEVVATGNATVDTRSGVTDAGGTFDVNLTDTDGEFSIRGRVVGTVDASRALLSFERYLTDEGLSATPPAAAGLDATGSADRDTASRGPVAAAGFGGSVDTVTRGDQTALPLQLNPWRRLGLSFLDVYWILATLLLGLVLVGLFPRVSRQVAAVGVNEPLRTGGAGLVVVLLAPLLLLLFGLSLFGIPVAIAGTGVYLVLGWVGAVYGRFTVGMWLLGVIPRLLAYVDAGGDVEFWPAENRWAGLLVGSLLVGLLALLPTVGPVLDGLVLLLGLGAVTRLAYGWYRRTERGGRPVSDRVPGAENP